MAKQNLLFSRRLDYCPDCGGISLHANANPTDWHDNELSQQIQAETQCELKGGIYENGVCLPPKSHTHSEKELRAYTAQKQAEINRTLGEKQ